VRKVFDRFLSASLALPKTGGFSAESKVLALTLLAMSDSTLRLRGDADEESEPDGRNEDDESILPLSGLPSLSPFLLS
jgi:hypothetical protein